MKNKKMIALDIAKSCVRIAEIEADGNHIKMLNTALLLMTSAFDSDGTPTNLKNLVSEICDKLDEMEVTAKNISLCCSLLGGEVKSSNAEKQKLTITELLQKKPFEGSQNNGKTSFGTIKNGEQIIEYFIESRTDEFLLAELARMFSERGFCLKSAEYTATAMLNLAALSRYSYDSRSKIIVELGESATAIITDHDIPIDIRHWNMDISNIENQITDYIIRDKMALKLKNPTVLICGTKLPENKFKEIKEELKSADVSLLDFVADCNLEPPYALCVALALKTAARSKINLLPQKTRHFLPPKLKARVKTVASCVAAAFLFFSVLLCGFSCFQLISSNLAIAKIPELQAKINTANTKINMFTDNAVTLKNAESKLTDFLNFASDYGGTNIFIASADTENMLPQTTVKSRLMLSEEIKTDNRKLVVRGYALSGAAALDFYGGLQAAGFAPRMNGIQNETLPSGETTVIFELEVIL